MERRLSVILSADLVGFTRMMERDETGTWAQLSVLRKELIDPTLTGRDGVIFKTTGDGMLAEFKNSIDAIEAAVAVQSAVYERYQALPQDERMVFRVGIDMGDVIVDGDDLIGDAVNVAARLQGVCQPGGVCISEVVFKAVERNTEIPFEDIGAVELRNRSDPVRSFVWRYGSQPDALVSEWQAPPSIRRGNTEKRADAGNAKASALPSVSVLPFQNFSNDEELGFLSSGIAEDITTALYRFKSFVVISRTSSFLYAGETKSTQEIGRELGAHYVLEGSIRKLGSRVRITAQLIDVDDGDHVWADNYDIDLPDIFEAQDQIVAKIAATLGGGIERHQLQRIRRLKPSELEAYELMLRGLELHKRGYVSYEQAIKAHGFFSAAVEKDPNLGRARAWRVCSSSRLIPPGIEPEMYNKILADELVELDKVLELDSEDPETHRMYGGICMLRRDFELAKFHFDKARDINPHNSHILARSAHFHCHYGEPETALELLDRAISINPHHPDWYWQVFGLACWVNEDYESATRHLVKSAARTDYDHAYLAASHAALGNDAEANSNARRFEEINPETTAEIFATRQPFRDPDLGERLKLQLTTAGLA
jgi:adenylate cyclase